MFQSLDIAADNALERTGFAPARDLARIGETLEMDIISVSPSIETDHEDNRLLQDGDHAEGVQRELRRCSEKRTGDLPLIAQAAVGEDTDEAALLQALLHGKEGIRRAQADNFAGQLRVDGI